MKELNKIDKPFTAYMQKVIPLAFNESLSYYEQLCLILKYIKTVITPTLNEHTNTINELQDKITKLQDYIDNYFNSDEFNNKITTGIDTKLNEMLENGELESIIETYLKLNVMLCFDNITLMKTSTTLENGSYVKTYGYTELNDKKGAFYKVRTKEDSDIIDDVNIIALQNNLVAILILSDDTTDITNRLDSLESSLNNTNEKVTTLETGLETTNNNVNTINNKLTFNRIATNITTENCSVDISDSPFDLTLNEDKTIMGLYGRISVNVDSSSNNFTLIIKDSNNSSITFSKTYDLQFFIENTTQDKIINAYLHAGSDNLIIYGLQGINANDHLYIYLSQTII